MGVSLSDLSFELTQDHSSVTEVWSTLSQDPRNSLHQSPLWCNAWAESQENDLYFLKGMAHGKCYLLLPLERQSKGASHILRPPGSSFNNINTGLIDAALETTLPISDIKSVRDRIAQAIAPEADLLSLTNMPLVWRGRSNVFSSLLKIKNQNAAFQLPLLESFEATLAQINAKRRRKKFKNSQKTAQALGDYRYAIAANTSEKQAILAQFFEQKAVRFAAHGLPDVFAPPSIKAFFQRLASAPDGEQHDSILELHYIELLGESAGTIVSVIGISRKGDHCICQFGSIDEAYAAALSPGELLFYHVIERENSLGTTVLFDFGIGDQRYKRSWCSVETEHYDFHISATARGKFLASWMRFTTTVKSLIKSNDQLYSFIQRLRSKRRAKALPDHED